MSDKGITRANLSPELIAELDALTSGGSAIYPADSSPTTIAWCGIPAGTDLSNKPLAEIIRMATTPYQKPEVTSITTAKTVYESGTSISSIPLTIKVTKKSNPITNISLYLGATLVNTFANVSNGGTFNYTYSNTINSNNTFKVVASDGTNSGEKSLSISFVDPMYVGLASGTLTKLVQLKGTGYTYSNINCVNDQVIFKYPQSYGNLKSIKDPNNFENINAFTKSTEVIGSVTYNVYTSNKATLTNFTYIFTF